MNRETPKGVEGQESQSKVGAAQSNPQKRGKRALWLLAMILVAVVGLVCFQLFSPFLLDPIPLRVARDTTYITSPLGDDGLPDFNAALNDLRGQPVPPEQNLMVLLVRAMGPQILGDVSQAGLLAALGDPEPLPPDERLITLEDYDANSDSFLLPEEPWTAEEEPLYSKWLDRNAKALDLTVNEPGYESSYLPQPVGVPAITHSTQISDLVALVRILRARVLRSLGSGNLVAALSDIQGLLRLGSFRQIDPTLIRQLVHSSTMGITRNLLARTLSHNPEQLPLERLEQLLARVRDLAPSPTPQKVFEYERLTSIQFFVHMLRPSDLDNIMFDAQLPWLLRDRDLLDVNVVLQRANTWYDAVDTELGKKGVEAQLDGLTAHAERVQAELESRTQARKWLWLRVVTMTPSGKRKVASEMIVDTLQGLGANVYATSLSKLYLGDANQQVMLAALAAKIYRKQTGAYPENLEALVPSLLDQVPNDPYADKPLTYRRTEAGFVVYSVGTDFVDDGGDPQGDVAIKITRTEPK